MSEDYEIICPDCGDYRNINPVDKDMNHVETVEDIGGGTVDFLQRWSRFHCDGCDTMLAVLDSETALRG